MINRKVIRIRDGETINSVVRRLKNTVEPVVHLVSDGADSLLANEVNLRLIHYYATQENKTVIIESGSPEIRKMCKVIGLTAGSDGRIGDDCESDGRSNYVADTRENYDSEYDFAGAGVGVGAGGARWGYDSSAAATSETELVNAPVSADRPVVPLLIKYAILGALLLVAIFIVAAVLSLLPSATVIIHPASRLMVTDLNVELSLTHKSPDLANKVLPATTIDRQDFLEFTIPTTGRAQIGYKAAQGLVTFINDNANPVTVPSGTIVMTQSGICFATVKEVVVPRRNVEYFAGVPAGLRAGQAEAAIVAVDPGVAGNVSARRIQTIQGPLAEILRVVNPEATFGGEDKQIRVVAVEDIELANAEAKKQALAVANTELAKLSGSDKYLFDELTKVEIQSINLSHQLKEETSEILVRVGYRATSLTVAREELTKMVRSILAASLPESFALVSDSVKLVDVTASPQSLQGAVLYITSQSIVQGVIDRRHLLRGLLGKTIAEAHEFLGSVEEVGEYQIKLSSSDAKSFPKWGARLKIVVVDAS